MAKRKEVYQNHKFEVLRYLSYALDASGVGLMLWSAYRVVLILNVPETPDHFAEGFIALIASLGVIWCAFSFIWGLLLLVLGVFINVFIEMEWNQRELIELQKQMIDALPEKENVADPDGKGFSVLH